MIFPTPSRVNNSVPRLDGPDADRQAGTGPFMNDLRSDGSRTQIARRGGASASPVSAMDVALPFSINKCGFRNMKENGMKHESTMLTPYRRSPRLTREMASQIKQRLAKGISQHDIAAEFGINQGRVSEVNTGRRFAEVRPQEVRCKFD